MVELMITLVIVGVLAAVGIPAYRNYVTRARVSEALVFADAARTRVDPALMQGRKLLDTEKDLLSTGGKSMDMITGVQWIDTPTPATGAAPAASPLGYILVTMKLPGRGDQTINALALQRMPNGSWICSSTAKVGAPNALEEKYLPPTCHGDGTALADAAPPNCPPDKDVVTLTSAGKTSSACTPKCAAGQTRDATNPTQCNSPATPFANTLPATTSVAHAQPTVLPVNPPAQPAAAPAGTANRPGPAAQAPLECHTCDPAVPELCELVTVPTTCSYPKNYCMTSVDNHADGSKEVKRYCGDYAEMYREWWQGTSDDDKCRSVDQGIPLDFRCTFACETPNCNQNGNVRPPEDSLFKER